MLTNIAKELKEIQQRNPLASVTSSVTSIFNHDFLSGAISSSASGQSSEPTTILSMRKSIVGNDDKPEVNDAMKPKGPTLSPMMEALNEEALEKARSMIARKFQNPVDIEQISTAMYQQMKIMAAAESQLNAAVQGKMDALKRAVDLMDESSLKLTAFANNMKVTDERIAQTNTYIAKYEYLKRVHNARDNLEKVISQVEFFARVPEKVASLREILDSEPHRLREVFLEALKLDSLRTALMKEIKVSRNRKMSVVGSGGSGGGGSKPSSSSGDYSEQTFMRIRGVVEEHLQSIPELMKAIYDVVNANLDRMWILAENSPADLVAAFEIVELHQEYLDRTRDQRQREEEQAYREGRAKGGKGGGGGGHRGEKVNEDVAFDARMRVRKGLEERVATTFEIALEEGVKKKSSKTSSTLAAATQVCNLVLLFRAEVLPCCPPHYDLLEEFLYVLEETLEPAIKDMVDSLDQLEPADILELIDWLEYYVSQVASFEVAARQSCVKFSQLVEELLNEYLQRNKSLIMEWMDNIRKGKMEVIKDKDGTLITDTPERMFFAVHQQIKMAKEKLPREHLKDLVNACLQVLRDVQRQSYDNMAKEWRKMDGVEMMVAAINDSQRMMEKTEELSEMIVSLVPQDVDREILSAMLDEVANQYVDIAATAGVPFLARYILEVDGDGAMENIFSKIFTSDWESGQDLISSIIVGTLNDYFDDLKVWMQGFFFPKFLKVILQMTVGMYIMALRRHGGNFKFRSEFTASSKVVQDWEVFVEYFEQHAEKLKQGGLRTKAGKSEGAVKEELSSLKHMAPIISSIHISGVEANVRALYDKWGDGHKLVLAIFNANPHMNKADKIENLELATKIFEKGVRDGIYKNTQDEMFKYVAEPAEDLTIAKEKAFRVKKKGFFG